MFRKYVNKENMKVVGDISLRIGKDILREGTMAVGRKFIFTGIGATLGAGGTRKAFNEITLNDVLGDIDRLEKKEERIKKKLEKKASKRRAKMGIVDDLVEMEVTKETEEED